MIIIRIRLEIIIILREQKWGLFKLLQRGTARHLLCYHLLCTRLAIDSMKILLFFSDVATITGLYRAFILAGRGLKVNIMSV